MISHPLSIIFQRKGKVVGQLGDIGENEGLVKQLLQEVNYETCNEGMP